MAKVRITQAKKRYGKFEALKGINVDVADGEFVVLVGPSGCGKSTLLRMIAGLEDISEGEISIGDTIVNDLPPKDRGIAMVFQNYALYPHMSVRDNMSYSLRLQKIPKSEINASVNRAAEILGLEELLDRQPKQLSGGQRQRVAMGRAIVREPEAFLFDEPLSNLDAALRVQMRSEIKALHHRLGTTIIYVTHDQVEAMTMADKIVVMRDGVIEQIGAPLELYDRPANTFVAGFIGSPAMSFIKGKVANGVFHTVDGIKLAKASHKDATTLGIRPEHLALSDNGIQMVVEMIEPTGAETQVAGKIGTQTIVGVFRERIQAKSGDQIQIAFKDTDIHLFGADGLRIQN